MPSEGRGWQIDAVRRTTWLELFMALTAEYMSDYSNILKFDATETLPYGDWQSSIQPYFPEWQNNLILPKFEFQEGLFIFKVALQKSVWRRIAIPAQGTLEELSYAILRAYDFDSDHLHEFIYTNHSGTEARAFHSYMDERPWTYEVSIGDLPIQKGSTMVYHFDFGDDWRFDVKLEKIDVDDDTIKETILLEEHGKAPEQYPSYDDEW
ncbi:MAG: hypothetical protein AAF702_32570 [Chloroflexota bacterium]